MSVRAEYVANDCRLVVTISCKDISSKDGIDEIFDELDVALNKIREKIGAPKHDYFLIDIVAEGVPPAFGEFGDPYEQGSSPMFPDAWKAFCPPFWMNARQNLQSRRRVTEWMGRLEETLKFAEASSLSTASLWEDDLTQFGEPLATHLSLIDIRFVPLYTRLLRLWDMGHEVHTGGSVVTIVNKHGITPETQELILCYTESRGFDERGLLELLPDRT